MINHAQRSTPPPEAIRVVLIDELSLVRYGLRTLCAATPDLHCVASVATADAGLAAVRRHRPRLVLLDSALDPAARLVADISATNAETTIVVLLRGEQRKTDFLRATRRTRNATTVPRDTDPGNLLAMLRQALRHQPPGEPGLPVEDADHAPTLSVRQLEVLVLVAHGHHNDSIARHLRLSFETVRTHVKAVISRLGARNRTHAVTIGFHLGLLTTSIDGQPTAEHIGPDLPPDGLAQSLAGRDRVRQS